MSILDNLNSLSKKAQEYADVAVDKAKDLAGVAVDKAKSATDAAKLNMAILTEQRELEKNYRAIGEWFISEYTGETPDAVKDVVAAVNASKARIAELEAEKASKAEPAVKEETVSVKVCPVCGAASEDKFCPKKEQPHGCSFFALFYCLAHSSEEEMPMSSSFVSRALSSFHIMVLPLRL